ncbi:hypothetical protein [Geothrix alkalitolerans]|uniref:hypothetical protein n=1 Tax=Geothrix alkalitolerans TaxID=2922724 RepID=UPI001FAEF2E0|nr:hypothetical protein [Geothrix alkalitolerans]
MPCAKIPFLALILLFGYPVGLAAQATRAIPGKPAQNKPVPTELITTPWILGAETADHWTGLLPTVNAPKPRARAYPGQHLTLAIGARGSDRDVLLKEGAYAFTVTFGGSATTFNGLHPSQIRGIKAEGADFAKYVMEQANVETKGLEDALSMVSLALFDLDWPVPAEARDGDAIIQGTVTTPGGKVTQLKAAHLEIWSSDRAVKEGAFRDQEEAGAWTMTYYQAPEPFRLLHALRLSKDDKSGPRPNVITFYVQVLKSSPLAAQDLMRRLSREDRVTRIYGLLLLSEAGYDLSSCLTTLPVEDHQAFQHVRTQAVSLPDPYDFSVNLDDPYQITTRMDMLWSIFLATGDQKPVRAIADTLAWREEGKAVLDLRRSGKKIEGITPGLLHGLAYGAGGWSLGSFVRNHGLVADFVEAWKRDPKTPAVIKEELGTLITNEAFKPK